MNQERNSIVINDADLYAFEIEAICEGFGFWGSPYNTGKRAVEILDTILENSGLTYNIIKLNPAPAEKGQISPVWPLTAGVHLCGLI